MPRISIAATGSGSAGASDTGGCSGAIAHTRSAMFLVGHAVGDKGADVKPFRRRRCTEKPSTRPFAVLQWLVMALAHDACFAAYSAAWCSLAAG